MNILLVIQIIIFVAFSAFVVIRVGWLGSISESWYKLEKKERWLFPAFILSMTITLIAQSTGWFVGSGMVLAFVAFAPFYKSKAAHTNVVHVAGACGGIALALAGLLKESIWFPAAGVLFCSIIFVTIFKLRKSRKTLWIENACFVLGISGLFFR